MSTYPDASAWGQAQHALEDPARPIVDDPEGQYFPWQTGWAGWFESDPVDAVRSKVHDAIARERILRRLHEDGGLARTTARLARADVLAGEADGGRRQRCAMRG